MNQMIVLTESSVKGNIKLNAEYAPLRCKLEATFYPERRQLGTWIGGGDDWIEDFEPCSTLSDARKILANQMINFMKVAEANL